MRLNNIIGIRVCCIVTGILFFLISCSEEKNYIPKPKGYFRIEFPEKKYITYDSICPFQFQYPSYAKLVMRNNNEYPCWMNLVFYNFNATLHLSYNTLQNNIEKYTEDSRTLAYKHTYKATNIQEQNIFSAKEKKYGTLYLIKGNTASSIQFHVTDSTTHFLRASLYFNNVPNSDSISPVLTFIEEDIFKFIETFNWK
jgi:gliding motility-associated lipoprotein GldD